MCKAWQTGGTIPTGTVRRSAAESCHCPGIDKWAGPYPGRWTDR